MARELDHVIGDDGLIHQWGARHSQNLLECHWWAPPWRACKRIALTEAPMTCIPCVARRPYVR